LAAVAHLAEGQLLCATEDRVKSVMLRDGTVGLRLSVKGGQK
jgi:hypothetical protein